MQSIFKLSLFGLAMQPGLALLVPDFVQWLQGPLLAFTSLLDLAWTEILKVIYAWASA